MIDDILVKYKVEIKIIINQTYAFVLPILQFGFSPDFGGILVKLQQDFAYPSSL
jgi:hypothetical protein